MKEDYRTLELVTSYVWLFVIRKPMLWLVFTIKTIFSEDKEWFWFNWYE